ncbi:MAG: hypothetical protein LBD20_01960, partial [Spirochaetaceae bacterium]|nr:hypothetical protein [Spirochaetaceae bacterium]
MILICILFCAVLYTTCTEIVEPDLSGIDGLSGYNNPIPPSWRKKNGRMVFYAEKSDGAGVYFFENAFAIPGGLTCRCGELYDCGCRAAGGASCACRKIAVNIDGLTPNSGEETGIVLAAASRNCECSAGSSCGCETPDGENCACEKKEFAKQKRAEFIIKSEDNQFKYTISFFAANSNTAEKIETGYTDKININKENNLSINYDAEKGMFIFFINKARIYPPPAESQSAFQFEINETSALYYYTAHGAAAPSRQSPYKREFRTESPQYSPCRGGGPPPPRAPAPRPRPPPAAGGGG